MGEGDCGVGRRGDGRGERCDDAMTGARREDACCVHARDDDASSGDGSGTIADDVQVSVDCVRDHDASGKSADLVHGHAHGCATGGGATSGWNADDELENCSHADDEKHAGVEEDEVEEKLMKWTPDPNNDAKCMSDHVWSDQSES